MQFSPFWIDFNDIHRLQLLQNMASYGTTAFAEMRRSASIPLAPSIDFLETANPDTLPQVDFSSHWSWWVSDSQEGSGCDNTSDKGENRGLKNTSSNEVPVGVIRSKLLEPPSFNNIRPVRELHLFKNRVHILSYNNQIASLYKYK